MLHSDGADFARRINLSRGQSQSSDMSLSLYRRRFAHLNRATDIVYSALREAILDGILAPGTWLREEMLAREFGVSRTPVREALQQLRREGLVTDSPHQGVFVGRLTVEDILAIYVVRESLEGLAARLAAMRATPEDCAKLEALIEAMRAVENDPSTLAELNLRFHAEVRRVAGNAYLDRFLTQIEHAIRRFGQTTLTYPGRPKQAITEHEAIVDAIRAHDPERAEAEAIRHMHEARELRLRMLIEGH